MMRDLSAGLRRGLPILLGYFPVALAFGMIARNAQVPLVHAAGMSAFVYAGASQFMALNLLIGGVPAAEIVAATLLLNFRHFLMSASLSARMKRPGRLTPLLAFGITDETFAVAASAPAAVSPGAVYLLGLEAAAYVGWLSGTVLGHALGAVLPPVLQGALGMGLYGLFIGILVPEARRSRRAALVACVSAAIHWLLRHFGVMPPGWSIIAAIAAGAAFGAALGDAKPAPPGRGAAG